MLIYAASLNYNTPHNVFQAHTALERGLRQKFPVYKDS
jgi:hypothetical protein